jgi:hypothetical protein
MATKFATASVICIVLVAGTGLCSQWDEETAGNGEWKMFFWENNEFSVFDDIIATDNGYLLAGSISGAEAENWDGGVVKIDKRGNKIWGHIYDRSESDSLDTLVKSNDGYIAQGTVEVGEKQWAIWTIKINEQGGIVWEQFIGESGNYRAQGMAGTRDGGAVIVADKNTGNRTEIALIKLEETGEIEWEHTYYEGPRMEAGGVVQTDNGGYAISGQVKTVLWLLKTDSHGNELWKKRYGAQYDFVWTGPILKTSDNGFLVSGMAFPKGILAYAYLVKTDAQGSVQWEREYHGRSRYGEETGAGVPYMIEIPEGYIFSTLTTETGKDGSAWLVKLDKQGDELWNKTFGDMYGCAFSGGVVAAEDGYVACGYWNRTAWVTKCGDYPPPKIELTHPRPGHVYLFDREIMPAQRTLILGDITFQVEVDDPLDKVGRIAFYVTTQDAYDKEPRHIDYEPPYEWEWDSPAIGIRWHYRIIVAAYYGNAGGSEADEIRTQVVNFGLT